VQVAAKGFIRLDPEIVCVVGDLLGIHNCAGHLDRAHEVEVVVAQVVCELLNLSLLHDRRVDNHLVVNWQGRGNCGSVRHHVEVKASFL